MPEQVQVTEQTYTREEAEAYHELMLEVPREAGKWIKLGEALEKEPLGLPGAVESFELVIGNVKAEGERLGVQQGNDLTAGEIRELFARLSDFVRYRRYCHTITERIRRYKRRRELPKLLTIEELEERYEHYLYKRSRKNAELGMGPRFEMWRTTEDCRTFYDDMR